MPLGRLLIIVNMNCRDVRNVLDTISSHENIFMPLPHKISSFVIVFVVVGVSERKENFPLCYHHQKITEVPGKGGEKLGAFI